MTVHRFPLRFRPFVLPGQKPETKEGAVIDLQERRSIVVVARALAERFEHFIKMLAGLLNPSSRATRTDIAR
jgi:hypothetical protein